MSQIRDHVDSDNAPVPRVWEAVTQSEQLNIWFVPVARVEAKLGGRCFFSWGAAESEDEPWIVTQFDPKKVFQISGDGEHDPFLRFEARP